MAGTNFLQFNPTSANQDDDAAYTADPLRSGGITLDAVMSSPLANKLFYQLSTMALAIANAMVAAGQNAQDASAATLSANFTTFIKFLAAAATQLIVLAFSSTPVFDASQGSGFEMTLSAAVTASTLENVSPGQIITFVLKQDGTGSHTFAWPSNVKGAGDIIADANSASVQAFYVDSTLVARPLTIMTQS